MSKKIMLSVGHDKDTFWQEVFDTYGATYWGRLPLTRAEVYCCAKNEQGQSLAVPPNSNELARVLCEWVAESFPRMPKKTEEFAQSDFGLRPFRSPGPIEASEQEWVFYGGSFNPWHEGHQACLDLMPRNRKLVIVPDRNPWKPNARPLSWKDLWQLALQAHDAGHSLYPGFFLMSEPNPTVSWLPKVPGKKSLLLGDDNLCQIKKWKDHEKLLSCLTSLYVAPREVSSELEALIEESSEYVRSFGIEVKRLGRHDYEHVSSTDIRAKKRPS